MPGRVWGKEGRTKGKKNEKEPAIHILIRKTDKYAGYPARMLVFTWEGVGRQEARKKERKRGSGKRYTYTYPDDPKLCQISG